MVEVLEVSNEGIRKWVSLAEAEVEAKVEVKAEVEVEASRDVFARRASKLAFRGSSTRSFAAYLLLEKLTCSRLINLPRTACCSLRAYTSALLDLDLDLDLDLAN